MEILNNIWSALNTENALLFRIISIPCTFIETYLMFMLFTTILKINYTKKHLFIYVFSVGIVSIICSYIMSEPFNVFINYAFIFILLLMYYHLNILQIIGAIIIPFAIFGLISSLILNPFIKLFNTTYATFYLVPIYHLIYLFFIYLIIFSLIYILNHIKIKNWLNINFDKRTKLTILVNLILGIFTLAIQAFLNFYYRNNIPLLFTFFNFSL